MARDAFIRNVAAFTEALGVEAAPVIIHLSMVPWPDQDVRDQFIQDLTGKNVRSSI